MLVNVVVYTFPSDQADEAARLLVDLADASRREEGCYCFDVSRSNDDARVFVLYEEWADAAALEAHFTTEHFVTYGKNGIRRLAESRTAYACTPLNA